MTRLRLQQKSCPLDSPWRDKSPSRSAGPLLTPQSYLLKTCNKDERLATATKFSHDNLLAPRSLERQTSDTSRPDRTGASVQLADAPRHLRHAATNRHIVVPTLHFLTTPSKYCGSSTRKCRRPASAGNVLGGFQVAQSFDIALKTVFKRRLARMLRRLLRPWIPLLQTLHILRMDQKLPRHHMMLEIQIQRHHSTDHGPPRKQGDIETLSNHKVIGMARYRSSCR